MPAGVKVDISKEQLERVCRMYNSNRDAARALGTSDATIRRWCNELGVESPYSRLKKSRAGKKKGYHDGKGARYGT